MLKFSVILLLGLILAPVSLTFAASPPTTSRLNSIVMLGPSNGWAVGDSGTVLHFDGFSWSPVPSGISLDLVGLSFGLPNSLLPTSGFAVGGSGGVATAIHWDGVAWGSITQGLSAVGSQRIASVSEVSPTDAWAADSSSGTIWHWSGNPTSGGWVPVSTAMAGLNSIFMLSSSEGWAVGSGGIIYRFTGGGWTLYSTVGTTLNSVFMLKVRILETSSAPSRAAW